MLHVEQLKHNININKCPLCGASEFVPYLTCKDYTVSNENFNIVSCTSCGFKFTNPRPADSVLGNYYKSEKYVSHSNTRKGLINKLYHFIRKRTLREKLKLISGYVSRGTILDYGCGTGMFLNTCKEAGWKVFGFEPDDDARGIAKESGLVVVYEKSALLQNKYDIISLWHVLEHVTDLDETLAFFSNVISINGRLIVAVPNHKSYDGQFYKEYWAGYDVPRHIYHFDPETIKALLSKFGFKQIDTKPMKFDSYYVSLLSEKYKTGSMKYFSAFRNGFRSNQKAQSPTEFSSVIYVFKKA